MASIRNRKTVHVVMPLFTRHQYLKKSLREIASWDCSIVIHFFQDIPPKNKANTRTNQAIEKTKTEALELSNTHHLHAVFQRNNEHKGCCKNVSDAITKAFEMVDFIYCIEDDVLVSPSFYEYTEACKNNINYDEHDIFNSNRFTAQKTWQTQGTKAQKTSFKSSIFRCWGWACHKKAWENIFEITHYNQTAIELNPRLFSKVPLFIQHNWDQLIINLNNHSLDSWATRFQIEIWKKKLKCINPYINMSTHIGTEGTHYKKGWNHHSYLPYYSGQIHREMLDIENNIEIENFVDEIKYIYALGVSPLIAYKHRLLNDILSNDLEIPSLLH